MHGQIYLNTHWRWLCDLLSWEMNKAVLLYCYRQWVDMIIFLSPTDRAPNQMTNIVYSVQQHGKPQQDVEILSLHSLLNQTCRQILYPSAALQAQIAFIAVFLWMLSDIRCFYCITMAMITHGGSLRGQKYCSCCACDTNQIRHSPGGGIGRPEVYLAVNLGHWVRRRDILRVLSSSPVLGSNRWRLLQAVW